MSHQGEETIAIRKEVGMARYGRSYGRMTSGGRRSARGYTLRGRYGRVNYVGVTNNASRRASEHRQDGKRGRMKVETRAMSRSAARRWEAGRLAAYRRNHAGRNPQHNQTRSGGWKD